jgi:hypothetical protein
MLGLPLKLTDCRNYSKIYVINGTEMRPFCAVPSFERSSTALFTQFLFLTDTKHPYSIGRYDIENGSAAI